mgnify:CR=1 FL=1
MRPADDERDISVTVHDARATCRVTSVEYCFEDDEEEHQSSALDTL